LVAGPRVHSIYQPIPFDDELAVTPHYSTNNLFLRAVLLDQCQYREASNKPALVDMVSHFTKVLQISEVLLHRVLVGKITLLALDL
jgi:hypothetical protein